MNQSSGTRPDHPVGDLIAKRWSPYAFSEQPVSNQDLLSLFEAARWAASSYNEQPWRFLVATKERPREFEAMLSCLVDGNQAWAQHAPVLALAARGRSPVGRATRAYGAYARREEEAMRDIVDDEQRRRRAVTPGRPSGWDGFGPAAALTLLNDDTASPASRRLAAHPKALPTRPAGLLPRAASVVSRRFERNGKPNPAAHHDLGLASASLTFEATRRGLSVHQMIGILPDRARELFEIPAGFDPFTGLAIGYSDDGTGGASSLRERDETPRTRRALAEFVFSQRWAKPFSPGIE